jgi:hypothetical protein
MMLQLLVSGPLLVLWTVIFWWPELRTWWAGRRAGR